MALNKFERSINKAFKQFNPEVDDLQMWNALEANLPQKKSKTRLAWIWFVGLFFASTIFYFGYIGLKETSQSSVDAFSPMEDRQPAGELTTELEADFSNDQLKADVIPVPSNDSKESESVFSNEQMVSENQRAGNIAESAIQSNANIIERAKEARKPFEDIGQRQVSDQLNETALIVDEASNQKAAVAISNLTKKGVVINSDEELALINFTTLENDLARLNIPSRNFLMEASFSSDFPIEENKQTDRHRWLLDFELAGGLTNLTLNSRLSANDPLLAKRRSIENALENIGGSMGLRYGISEKFGASIGFELVSIQQGSLNNREKINTEIQVDTTAVIYVGAVSSFETGPTEKRTISRSIIQRYNTFSDLSISVGAYYKLINLTRLDFRVYAKYGFGLAVFAEGFDQELEGNEYDLSIDEENRLSNQLNYLNAGFSFDYRIRQNLDLCIGFSFRKTINDLYNENYFIGKRLDLYRTNIGLSFKL